MSNTSFVDYVLDTLSSFGNIKARKMFGGYGIYKDNTFFAIIADDILYFKAGKGEQSFYESQDSKPFLYEKNGKRLAMNYWQCPADVLENHDLLTLWVKKSLEAVRCAKK